MLDDHYQRHNTEVDIPQPIGLWQHPKARLVYILDEAERAPAQAIIPCSELPQNLAEKALCLGVDDKGPLLLLHQSNATIDQSLIDEYYLAGLRHLPATTSVNLDALLHAHGLMNWHRFHQYCERCGHKTEAYQGGLTQRCPHCETIHFPRTDPCVIVRVERRDSICLGGQQTWPAKQRSVLAGFIETGESAEHCVTREVKEESNLDIYDIRYLRSQSWPFPRSLMLAYSAQNDGGDFDSINEEITDLKWYNPEQLAKAIQQNEIHMPAAQSIAWWMIDQWYYEKTNTRLAHSA